MSTIQENVMIDPRLLMESFEKAQDAVTAEQETAMDSAGSITQ